jgi:hypothetical protein
VGDGSGEGWFHLFAMFVCDVCFLELRDHVCKVSRINACQSSNPRIHGLAPFA